MSVGPALAAAIGAGGALIGGGITAASNVWLEGNRAKRGAEADRERAEREVRRAARLVFDELRHSMAVLEQAEKDDEWGDADRKELKYNRWAAHQQALADHLPDDDWFVVGGAYELLYVIYRGTASEEGEPSVEAYAKVKSCVGKALKVLRRYASGYQGTVPRLTSD